MKGHRSSPQEKKTHTKQSKKPEPVGRPETNPTMQTPQVGTVKLSTVNSDYSNIQTEVFFVFFSLAALSAFSISHLQVRTNFDLNVYQDQPYSKNYTNLLVLIIKGYWGFIAVDANGAENCANLCLKGATRRFLANIYVYVVLKKMRRRHKWKYLLIVTRFVFTFSKLLTHTHIHTHSYPSLCADEAE